MILTSRGQGLSSGPQAPPQKSGKNLAPEAAPDLLWRSGWFLTLCRRNGHETDWLADYHPRRRSGSGASD
jgi:hypothetical protein